MSGKLYWAYTSSYQFEVTEELGEVALSVRSRLLEVMNKNDKTLSHQESEVEVTRAKVAVQ